MYFPSAILFLTIFGKCVCSHHTDIDLNRIRHLPNELSPIYNSNNRRSVTHDFYRDNYSSEKYDQDFKKQNFENEVIQTHQPKEDPRLFYQSESYLSEVKDQNHDVTYIYPGREVVNADEEYRRPGRLRKMVKGLTLDSDDHNLCMQCPRDRTLIAKAGSDKVVLQRPRILSCTGKKAPRQVRLVPMYGPSFGSLLHQGSHIVVGKIMYNSRALQMCKMQVYVILQSCPVPRSLKVHCNDHSQCNFTCRDPKLELQGRQTLVCGDDLKWEGNLPICKGRKWCMAQPPPEYGKISCKGTTIDNGLAEGSRCRVRCRIGWKAQSTVAVCRRGSWNHELTCQPKHTIDV